jgi:hypothetical protein
VFEAIFIKDHAEPDFLTIVALGAHCEVLADNERFDCPVKQFKAWAIHQAICHSEPLGK